MQYGNHGYYPEIIAASIGTANHVTQAALAGTRIATIPPAVIKKLAEHPSTDNGINQFL